MVVEFEWGWGTKGPVAVELGKVGEKELCPRSPPPLCVKYIIANYLTLGGRITVGTYTWYILPAPCQND